MQFNTFLRQFDALQKGVKSFIPKRDIRNNVVEAHYILRQLVRTKNKSSLLLLDFEKAYDRVDCDFLYKVLKCVNCGATFIHIALIQNFLF